MATVAEQLDAFIARYNGVCVNVDGYYGCQCMDLVLEWERYLGLPMLQASSAWDSWSLNPDPAKYQKIAAGNQPQKGDILVWGSYMGQFGHTAIFVSGSANTFTSFDQNFPEGNSVVGSPAKLITYHVYAGLLGWFRPIAGSAPPLVKTVKQDTTQQVMFL